jgi:hypothetical protein
VAIQQNDEVVLQGWDWDFLFINGIFVFLFPVRAVYGVEVHPKSVKFHRIKVEGQIVKRKIVQRTMRTIK